MPVSNYGMAIAWLLEFCRALEAISRGAKKLSDGDDPGGMPGVRSKKRDLFLSTQRNSESYLERLGEEDVQDSLNGPGEGAGAVWQRYLCQGTSGDSAVIAKINYYYCGIRRDNRKAGVNRMSREEISELLPEGK